MLIGTRPCTMYATKKNFVNVHINKLLIIDCGTVVTQFLVCYCLEYNNKSSKTKIDKEMLF